MGCSRYHTGCYAYRITPTTYKCESKQAARNDHLAAFLFAKILSCLLTNSQMKVII
nr:MAG TPA: hypothetical protein [Caudoviricetes sp.]